MFALNEADLRLSILGCGDGPASFNAEATHDFIWDHITSVDELGRVRMSAMTDFLGDFDRGRAEGRYVDAELPSLPFGDRSFELALCSHFLFLYTTQLGEAIHYASFRELCRVATEIRVFPILELGGGRSPLVEPIVNALRQDGFHVDITRVPYEFRRGGNEMLRITGTTVNAQHAEHTET